MCNFAKAATVLLRLRCHINSPQATRFLGDAYHHVLLAWCWIEYREAICEGVVHHLLLGNRGVQTYVKQRQNNSEM
jgi:hypothetical protein